MLLGRVVGSIWGAKHAPTLDGFRLLVVKPLTASCNSTINQSSIKQSAVLDGEQLAEAAGCLVAVDNLGAGPGELVLVAHGSRCRDLTVGASVAEKDIVIAIVDQAQVKQVKQEERR